MWSCTWSVSACYGALWLYEKTYQVSYVTMLLKFTSRKIEQLTALLTDKYELTMVQAALAAGTAASWLSLHTCATSPCRSEVRTRLRMYYQQHVRRTLSEMDDVITRRGSVTTSVTGCMLT